MDPIVVQQTHGYTYLQPTAVNYFVTSQMKVIVLISRGQNVHHTLDHAVNRIICWIQRDVVNVVGIAWTVGDRIGIAFAPK